jgi:ferredoxin--NADP+ reductase
LYEIIYKEVLSDTVKLIKVKAPLVAAKAQPGQFVMVITKQNGERIPLTIADFHRKQGAITLVFQEVGKTTMEMGTMRQGDGLFSLTGPLGNPSECLNYGTVLCVAGGVGIAPMYPIARKLKQTGNKVITIIGARNKNLLFWQEKMKNVSQQLIICTDDGSTGLKALVTEPLKELLEQNIENISRIWVIGPAIMMKFCSLVSKEYNIPTIVSLNSIMIDGTGMCGGCRIEENNQTKYVCVDGPEFDGHQVDWNLLLSRQSVYLEQEKIAVDYYNKQKHTCKLKDSINAG